MYVLGDGLLSILFAALPMKISDSICQMSCILCNIYLRAQESTHIYSLYTPVKLNFKQRLSRPHSLSLLFLFAFKKHTQ